MTESGLQAQIESARAYDALFVPALFGQWAPKLARAAQLEPGQRVLDVACGTGVLARQVDAETGPTGYVAGLDAHLGMLAVARELAPTVDWRHGAAEAIPFPDRSFDRVVSQFGLMFFDDPTKGVREMLRVFAPDGRLVVAVWDSLDSIPAYADEVAVLERLAGGRAADAVRVPFTLGERQRLTELFGDAGAASIDITTERGTARFPSVRVMVEADLRGWLPVMGVTLGEQEIGHIVREAERVLGSYVTADGTVEFDCAAHVVIATA